MASWSGRCCSHKKRRPECGRQSLLKGLCRHPPGNAKDGEHSGKRFHRDEPATIVAAARWHAGPASPIALHYGAPRAGSGRGDT
jgi:hypothetical protein